MWLMLVGQSECPDRIDAPRIFARARRIGHPSPFASLPSGAPIGGVRPSRRHNRRGRQVPEGVPLSSGGGGRSQKICNRWLPSAPAHLLAWAKIGLGKRLILCYFSASNDGP
jgi:hypothetical protein